MSDSLKKRVNDQLLMEDSYFPVDPLARELAGAAAPAGEGGVLNPPQASASLLRPFTNRKKLASV